MKQLSAVVAWGTAAIVLAGVLTAWVEPSAGGLLYAALLALGSLTALVATVHSGFRRVHWAAVLLFGSAVWGAIQVKLNWTVYGFETWSSVNAWLAAAAVFSLACASFQQRERIERLRWFAIVFGGTFSLLTLLQWYTGGGSVFWIFRTAYSTDVAGTFANRDHYSALIELLLPIALASAVGGSRHRPLSAACAGIMFASVIASGSRAGAIIVSAEVLAFVLAACLGRRQNYRAAALVLASIVLCTLVGGWTYLWERFSTSDPFAFRREMLVATTDMIRARPLTGFGLGTWPAAYPAFALFDPPGVYMNHAHNDWAEWTAEGGLPLLAMLLVFAAAAAQLVRRNMWGLGILAVLTHSLVDFPLQKPALVCAVFFLAGVLAASSKVAAESGSCESQLP